MGSSGYIYQGTHPNSVYERAPERTDAWLVGMHGWACGVGGSSEHPVNELVKLVVGWSAYKHDAKRGFFARAGRRGDDA